MTLKTVPSRIINLRRGQPLLIALAIAFLPQVFLVEHAFSDDDAMAQSALEFQSARFNAMVEEDMESLEQFLADDLTYSHTTGWTETKSEFLSTVASRKVDYLSMSPEDVEVRVYGDLAIMTGLSRLQGVVGDRKISFTIRFLDVSRRVGDSWQLVAWQSVKIPEN